MGRIVYSENIGFDLSEWQSENLVKVAAGSNCVAALTAGGKVLTKSRALGEDEDAKPSFGKKLLSLLGAYRGESWEKVKDLAVSGSSGVVVGLLTNGSCLMKRGFSGTKKLNAEIYRKAVLAVSSWKNIVAIAVSDAVFGLDSFGRVYCAPLLLSGDYRETAEWRNIVRVVTGGDGLVFGITSDGRVATCGGNFSTSQKRALEGLRDAVDLGVAGTNSREIVVAHRDGTVENLRSGMLYDFRHGGKCGCVASHRGGIVVQDLAFCLHFIPCGSSEVGALPFGLTAVSSFALGDVDCTPSFVVGIQN